MEIGLKTSGISWMVENLDTLQFPECLIAGFVAENGILNHSADLGAKGAL